MVDDSTSKQLHGGFSALIRFLPLLYREYVEKGCRQQAAALTYMTLFAIVPTMTVIFTMFSLFPAFEGMSDRFQAMMFQYVMPESGLEIEQYLTEFTAQARSLTMVGVLMLVATAYFMIKNIERTFNGIWGVIEARKGLPNFLLYWAVLSLGPLLLGVGLAISTYLLSLRFFVDEYDALGIIPTILSYSPWLFTTMAFTLLFAAVPNCKVPFKDALAGGVLTAICFELFKDLFGWIVAHTTFTAVYGAFAMVPLFLLWIYALWMIVLAGAVFVRTLSTFKTAAAGASYPDLIAALLALWKFHLCQRTGEGANDEQLMAIGIESEQWQRVRGSLLRHRVITVSQQGDYVLSRDLSTFTLRNLADMVGVESQMPGVSDYLQTFDWFPNVASRLLSIDQHVEVEFDVPVSELFWVAAPEEDHYPDEGEGLEALREELGAVSREELTPPESGTTEVTLSALGALDSDIIEPQNEPQNDLKSENMPRQDSPRHG
ncbi:MAG: YihY family inner membrane protein [Cellvibrionaceae bacterium]